MFRALLLEKTADDVTCRVVDLDDDRLPDGNVTIAVDYSTLNYKDALAITNTSPIVRAWPMVPGVDLAGVVEASADDRYAPGDRVVLNGWEIGETRWGGLTTHTRVDADWLVHLPDAISTRQAMAIGTAGYTAMLCVLALEEHDVSPEQGPVVVTGAAGGVGSVAIAILSGLGHEVHAVTGRADEQGDYLRALGAAEIIDRATLTDPPRPLGRATWSGGIDAVGGTILANVLSMTKPHGCVAACGLVQSMDLPTSVAPFILRGVALAGVNSVYEPVERRRQAWSRLASDLDPDRLESMIGEIGLTDVTDVAPSFLDGSVKGRIVVDVRR
ncbi:MAG: oxidoreductase [Acidimicrobiia bacterium]|nr:oxidoreductase [Acidimicrobiia bacterium]